MYRARNKVTGLWFVRTRGFAVACKHFATMLTGPEAFVVEYSYNNVILEVA